MRLSKVDIKSAYRIVPIHPEDRLLLGMMWNGSLFIDCVLPFGLRFAPRIFTAIADVLEWRVKFESISRILHCLDDFLIISKAGSDEGNRNLQALLALFDRLGVPVAIDKVEGPVTCITFLGIELDSEQMVLRLPEYKLQALRVMAAEWLRKKSCTIQDLQSLIGKLQHASKVIRPGRTFLCSMFKLLKSCGS